MPGYSEMQKLINYVNDFRTLPSKKEAYKKGSVSASPPDTCYPDPCKHHHSEQRQKAPPASAVPTAKVTHLLTTAWLKSDPATQQKHCYLHSLGRKQQRCSCKGWTPIVKQGRKKSKHKERMDQTKFAFPFSQGQELGLAVHNFCYITPVHYSRNCGRTQK